MMPDPSPLYPAPPPPRPEHEAALESDLLRRFDARLVPARRRGLARPARRLAFGSLLVAGLAAASQAPVESDVVVGHRFTLVLPSEAPLPPPDALGRALRGPEPKEPGAHQLQIELHVYPPEDKGLTVVADVWSDASPTDIEARLRSVPELAGATLTVSPLEGRIRESFAQRLGHEMFDIPSDPASVEAARQKLQAELAARGEKGKVDVQVDDSEPGKHKVMVKVTKDGDDEGSTPPTR
jgi:hypothetical protein